VVNDVPTVLLVRPLPALRNLSMERYTDALAASLRARGDLRTAETTIGPSNWARGPLAAGIDRRLTRFVRFRRHLSHQHADIYHFTNQTQADLATALPLQRTIVTVHDLMLLRAEEDPLGFRGSWPAVRLFRWRVGHLRRVAHVACISEQTRRDVIELVGVDPARTSVIPNGIDERFQRLPAEQLGQQRPSLLPAGSSLLLHVSTGEPYKNVEGTLRTLAALRGRGRDAVLVRVGQPLTRAQSDLADRLGLVGAIRDLGRVSDERLIELYNLADVLLFPSHYEGFGWPPLEAMACGTPVVTSQAAALLEVTGDAALHAPADDATALANAVESILTDPVTADRLTTLGFERAAQYRWETTAASFAELYQAVLTTADM